MSHAFTKKLHLDVLPQGLPGLLHEEMFLDRRRKERSSEVAPTPLVSPRPPANEPAADAVTIIAEPASVWRRIGAWLIDVCGVGMLGLGLIAGAMALVSSSHLTLTQQLSLLVGPALGLTCLLAFAYLTVFACLWNGRTPGYRALGIHLVDQNGCAPGPVRAWGRAMLSLVSFSLFLSGLWLALFDRHGQTLHDKLTQTFVVKL